MNFRVYLSLSPIFLYSLCIFFISRLIPIPIPRVGDLASVSGGLPIFSIPSVPLNFLLLVGSETVSVFFVSGDSDSPEVVETNIYKENGFAYIDKEITDKKFRIFIFYGL